MTERITNERIYYLLAYGICSIMSVIGFVVFFSNVPLFSGTIILIVSMLSWFVITKEKRCLIHEES